MPAMLVLPLVDHAIAKSFGDWQATGSIRVGVTIANERIRLALSQTGNQAEDDERILAIRERLTALYAGDASLAMQRWNRTGQMRSRDSVSAHAEAIVFPGRISDASSWLRAG